jgi:hypothetical protein
MVHLAGSRQALLLLQHLCALGVCACALLRLAMLRLAMLRLAMLRLAMLRLAMLRLAQAQQAAATASGVHHREEISGFGTDHGAAVQLCQGPGWMQAVFAGQLRCPAVLTA